MAPEVRLLHTSTNIIWSTKPIKVRFVNVLKDVKEFKSGQPSGQYRKDEQCEPFTKHDLLSKEGIEQLERYVERLEEINEKLTFLGKIPETEQKG